MSVFNVQVNTGFLTNFAILEWQAFLKICIYF